MLESLFTKVAGLKACNFIKETPKQVFFCKYCENFMSTLLYRTPPVAASVSSILKIKRCFIFSAYLLIPLPSNFEHDIVR